MEIFERTPPESKNAPYTSFGFVDERRVQNALSIIRRTKKDGGGILFGFTSNGVQKVRMELGEKERKHLIKALSEPCCPGQ